MNGTIETKKPTTGCTVRASTKTYLKNTGRIMSQKQKKQQARRFNKLFEKAWLDDAYFD
jgi:hypothetical protein